MKVLLNPTAVSEGSVLNEELKNLPKDTDNKPVDITPLENTADDWENDDVEVKPSSVETTPSVEAPDVSGEDIGKLLTDESQTPDTPALPNKRDYSIFRDEDKQWVEKLPNAAFDAVKRRLPDLYNAVNRAKELEERLQSNQVPESWHQHPQAFLLSPEFRSKQTLYSRAELEHEHFNNQAIEVENGASSYKMLKGYEPETGKPVFEDIEIPPGKNTEVRNRLLQYSMRSATVRDGAVHDLKNLQQTFAQRYEKTANELKEAEKVYFPFFENPTDEYKKMFNDVQSKIPAIYHNHPLMPYTVKLGTLVRLLSNKLKDTMSKQAVIQQRVQQEHNAQDETLTTPAATNVNQGASLQSILEKWEDD